MPKKLLIKFKSLKLKYKLTLLILIALIIPIGFFIVIFFSNLSASTAKEQIKSLEYDLIKSEQTIEQNVEMCSLATQVIANSQVLNDYLMRFSQDETFETKELLNFYTTEINGLEKIVNSNPYLNQIRIYIDSQTMPEMMPILYRSDRIPKVTSKGGSAFLSGTWYFDYKDELFPQFALNKEDRIVSLVTVLTDSEYGNYGLAEVATTMETMFPDIYSSDPEHWTCFVDAKGKFYYDPSSDEKWVGYLEQASKLLDMESKEGIYQKMTLGIEDVVVGYTPVEVLDGYLLKFVSLQTQQANMRSYLNQLLLILAVSLVLLVVFFSYLVKVILRQFYTIADVVHEVQQGDLDVRILDCQKDEIGVLGYEINQMLDYIEKLIEENVNREVLMKNSQILALQNQINAHFIYNVLESIKMMAEIDEKFEISDAVTSLGKLLRYSMRWNSQNVTVEEEVDYIRNYLALINLRFDYEIYLSMNMPQEIWRQSIPKMSLQPIIENAISHGIEEIAEDTCIYMKGIIEGDSCTIKITDSGCGMSYDEVSALQGKIEGKLENSGGTGNGIGLKNVQDRIQISFGKKYGLSIHSKEGCYTQVGVKIPFERKSEVL